MTHRHATEVGFVTDDADRLVAFLMDAFGFHIERVLRFDQGTVHRLVLDDARCKVFQPADITTPPDPVDPWYAGGGIAYAALHVADVTDTTAAAVAAGASVIVGPTHHRPGATFSMVRDPDGNCWELLAEEP